MLWSSIYLVIASAVAATVFVVGQWLTQQPDAAAEHPILIAAIAGVLWPVLALGMTEALLLKGAARRSNYPGSSHTTSDGDLSGRNPRQLGWRNLSSDVISP
jgi:hypothetical protein